VLPFNAVCGNGDPDWERSAAGGTRAEGRHPGRQSRAGRQARPHSRLRCAVCRTAQVH
jgi:hypothetical protein